MDGNDTLSCGRHDLDATEHISLNIPIPAVYQSFCLANTFCQLVLR